MAKPTPAATLGLLFLDLVSTALVFNAVAVAYLHGAAGAGQLIVEPLFVPAAIIVFSIYLIEGYRAGTDMLSIDYTSQHAIALTGAMMSTLLLTYVVFPAGYPL